MEKIVVSVKNLKISFPYGKQWVDVVDGVSLEVAESEILGIVGESGCGKSMTAHALMRLVPYPGKVQADTLCFNDNDLSVIMPSAMRALRGKEIGMVFQEPMTSLNPLFTIGFQIEEALRVHTNYSRSEVRSIVAEKLDAVAFPYTDQAYSIYPHQLSGGMRQRAMIAMAIACDPQLVIADEPTTALDVTVQAQIMQLFKQLVGQDLGSLILISHDLSLVMEIVDRIAIMYAGYIVEVASSEAIHSNPLHPYTRGLLAAIPDFNTSQELVGIPGDVPAPYDRPQGCRFLSRCPFACEQCEKEQHMHELKPSHSVRCWRAKEWTNI